MFARTALRRSAHGASSTTWVTSNGNPGHQYIAWVVFGVVSGGSLLYSKLWMNNEGRRIAHKASESHHAHHWQRKGWGYWDLLVKKIFFCFLGKGSHWATEPLSDNFFIKFMKGLLYFFCFYFDFFFFAFLVSLLPSTSVQSTPSVLHWHVTHIKRKKMFLSLPQLPHLTLWYKNRGSRSTEAQDGCF